MPTSSRKRNKGKDRKAKKEAKKEDDERLRVRDLWQRWTFNTCDHGCTLKVPDYHPVLRFMDLLFSNIWDNMDLFSNMRGTLQKCTEVWSNDVHRKLALDILTNIGTNKILIDDSAVTRNALYIANAIIILEQYYVGEDISSIINNPSIAKKMRDLHPVGTGKRRDGLKFYRKRTSCKCLKKIHLEARKTTYKTDTCITCGTEKRRELVAVCSRCMVNPYCSRKCQVANWPMHRIECNRYVHESKRRL